MRTTKFSMNQHDRARAAKQKRIVPLQYCILFLLSTGCLLLIACHAMGNKAVSDKTVTDQIQVGVSTKQDVTFLMRFLLVDRIAFGAGRDLSPLEASGQEESPPGSSSFTPFQLTSVSRNWGGWRADTSSQSLPRSFLLEQRLPKGCHDLREGTCGSADSLTPASQPWDRLFPETVNSREPD